MTRDNSLENVIIERTQEIFDCLSFSNFDFNKYSLNLISERWNLVYHYFSGYMLSPGAIKTCHPLPTRKDSGRNVPIITKFAYFSDKDEIFGRMRMLSGQNGVQGKSSFINGRLPKSDIEVKRKCDDMNLITTTHNCQVKVFFAND